MNTRSKIVSFERSAGYLHERAMRSKASAQRLDALELMRGAVEKSPDKASYRMDLAKLYAEIGQFGRSDRILLDLLSEHKLTQECLCALAVNRAYRGDLQGARMLLDMMFNQNDEAGTAEVRGLFEELEFLRVIERSVRRSTRFALNLVKSADRLRERGDARGAVRLYRKAEQAMPMAQDVRAGLALSLLADGHGDEAKKVCEPSVDREDADVRLLCAGAKIALSDNERKKAIAYIDRAIEKCENIAEIRLVTERISEAGLDERMRAFTSEQLRRFKDDPVLLHCQAVSRWRMGEKPETLVGYWARTLRIDPEDAVAAYYRDCALENAPNAPDYAYALPAETEKVCFARVREALSLSDEALLTLWNSDAPIRTDAEYTLRHGSLSQQSEAIALWIRVGDEDAMSSLRLALCGAETSADARQLALLMVEQSSLDLGKLIVAPPVTFARQSPASMLPAADRQMLRYASEVMADHGHPEYDVVIMMLWCAYAFCHRTKRVLNDADAIAAALAFLAINHEGERASAEKLARYYRTSQRRLLYYAANIAQTLNGHEGETEKT